MIYVKNEKAEKSNKMDHASELEHLGFVGKADFVINNDKDVMDLQNAALDFLSLVLDGENNVQFTKKKVRFLSCRNSNK